MANGYFESKVRQLVSVSGRDASVESYEDDFDKMTVRFTLYGGNGVWIGSALLKSLIELIDHVTLSFNAVGDARDADRGCSDGARVTVEFLGVRFK